MNTSNTTGNQNIVIQGVTDSHIMVNVDGKSLEILRKLDALAALLEGKHANTIQTADKIYNISSITNANFDFIVEQIRHPKTLPDDLAENIITDDNLWVLSLRQELLKQGVTVKNTPASVFQHYGWLIEEFLRKMNTPAGREPFLHRLSFMAEVFQNSLRYLCFIQMAQLLKSECKSSIPLVKDFLALEGSQYVTYDFLNLLLVLTDSIVQEESFIPPLSGFAKELADTKSDVYSTALFLEKHRNALLANTISEDDQLKKLLDEYLTALVFWLRKLSFLAKYRLVSIKEISLKYRLGTPKNFVHLYGELHGIYQEAMSTGEGYDYNEKVIEGLFTYNQSVLLFNGNNVEACMDNISDPNTYLSLSPLLIDQSVFLEKTTQTPEIYYYTGYGSRQYHFVQYKNELVLGDKAMPSNKELRVKAQNNQQPSLDELFEQMEQVFAPFKAPMP